MAPGHWPVQAAMLRRVALALGPELAQETAFVGGCTVGLMLTDPVALEAVRFTEDVDVIIHVLGPGKWYQFEKMLAARGFRSSPLDEVICRKRLRDDQGVDLVVDFMPDDPAILGFGNRWYAAALRDAEDRILDDGVAIRVVTPPYFLGTKLEAWQGRGNNDPLASRDVEDILSVVDGRPALYDEVAGAEAALRLAIAEGVAGLLGHRDFTYVVQSAAGNNRQREALLFQRLDALAAAGR